jgi:protein N-terminal glutamine amidohydrolase
VVTLDRKTLDYQALYCEENVWRLLSGASLEGAAAWAVIVSNAARSVLLLRQAAGRPVDGLVLWDYHVFAVLSDPIQGRLALDMDSDLPLPCPLASYLRETFPADVHRSAMPRFRVMEGGDYLADFVSDRSHMRRPDGSWLAPPPPWPAPGQGSGRPSVLMDWADMGRPSPGVLYDSFGMAAFAAGSGVGVEGRRSLLKEDKT